MTEPLFRQDPIGLVEDARERYQATSSWALFSGGYDSAVLTHWAHSYGFIDGVLHVDTGIGIAQTHQFVRDFCAHYDMPLHYLTPPGLSYDEYVLEHGFPGPRDHGIVYWRLKELAINAFVQEHKRYRKDRIVLLHGVRRAESWRRKAGVTRATAPVRREGTQVWVGPLLDWSDEDLQAYRLKHRLPENEVASLLHRSGECLCGCFVRREEFDMIASLYPEFGERVRVLEEKRRAVAPDKQAWGADRYDRPTQAAGPMCSDCQLSLEAAA